MEWNNVLELFLTDYFSDTFGIQDECMAQLFESPSSISALERVFDQIDQTTRMHLPNYPSAHGKRLLEDFSMKNATVAKLVVNSQLLWSLNKSRLP